MPKRPCAAAGCCCLVDRGYCAQHQARAGAARYDVERGTAAARGYDRRWRRFRLRFLREHPLCADCLEERPRRVTPATDVHHVARLRDRPDLMYVESNLRALCGAHHDGRTARGQ